MGGRAGKGGGEGEREEEETGFPHLLYLTESSIFAATPSVQFSIEAISGAEPEHKRGRSRKLTPVLGRTSGAAPLPGARPQLTLQSPLQGPGVFAVGGRGERLAWAPAIWPPSVPLPGVTSGEGDAADLHLGKLCVQRETGGREGSGEGGTAAWAGKRRDGPKGAAVGAVRNRWI